ncbi:MAG: type I-C CRISPR-associated endonuclease Cas1c, partial [Eubacteriales bacterium]
SIVLFSNMGMSPKLMEKCVEDSISVCFMTSHGRFRARLVGPSRGNVLLRKKQYAVSEDKILSLSISKNMVLGKIFNEKWQVERYLRDYPLRIDTAEMRNNSDKLSDYLKFVRQADSLESLRGYEGTAQVIYFNSFDHMILNNKEDFYFRGRNKRPPLDRINCLLSFFYTLLANDTAAALEAVGLDAYVGFMHTDRSGRVSLALDMMEEFRCTCVDRFVLSVVNRKQVAADDFEINENGSVIIKDEPRKVLLKEWQKRKQEMLTHPFLKEKISWGLLPHVQAMLLARYLRGDLDAYPPFMWK